MGQRFKIDRDFLRAICPNGKYQEFVDADVRAFVVKVTPSGRVSYTIRWTKPDGSRGRRVLGYWPDLNPGEARELAKKALRDVDKSGDTTADVLDRRRRKVEAEKIIGTPTLAAFINDRYADWLMANTRASAATVARLRRSFSDHQDRPLSDFTAWIIEKWRAARMKAGVGASTVNRDLSALRGLFSRAVEWGVLAEHPMRTVKALQAPSGKVRWLSDDEEARLRAALAAREERERAERESANAWRTARGYGLMQNLRELEFVDYLKPAVLLSLNTGLRQGELLKLDWRDVNLDRALLTVVDASSKSGKQRHIPLNEEALAVLISWRKQQTKHSIVFAGATGGVRTDVKTAWSKLLLNAEITNFRWHDMRHHFASRLVMAGVDLNTVRELLGHADLTMTLRYAHLAPEHLSAAVAKLDRHPQSSSENKHDRQQGSQIRKA
ncbi:MULTISPECIES: tyrosine-type recombinase/integrase [unclassified Caballeronia]|uniref:phage integrase n=1 Tax=unclassified Caballeronia TaxID=2646786 RepID=UPI002864A865|nr:MULTISPECIES: tyrosine-type recombinase/integrase [unclassified Caballeronia]MDR5772910.1 tyrosine-type recombinase/integrase [Caballeronia sp. LZ002]MDR5803627.1 tyrosine-type recombinase/integrase [Caballeronia sp. LZ001]MDR5848344.1 tyrosine-type recombinase/integrase [Caballeronia sp. LZ003]